MARSVPAGSAPALLFRGLIWRPLRQDAGRTLLSLFAIALGVAVVVAIRVANRSAIAAFQQANGALGAGAALLATGPRPIPATLLPQLFSLNADAEFLPYLDRRAYDPAHQDVLEVLGVDLLAMRDLEPAPAAIIAPPAAAPAGLAPILLPAGYARRHQLRVGDRLELTAGGRPGRFVVAAVLPATGAGAAGGFALLDLGAALRLFEPSGPVVFDGLRVFPAPGASLPALERALRLRLPPPDAVAPPGARVAQDARMFAAFRANLDALAYVSLLIGVFLIYNTISISVVRRRTAIATVRALGVSRGWVLALFLGEGAALALCGGVLGWGLGWALAASALALVERTVNSLYAAAPAAPMVLARADLFWSLGLAVAAGMGAALAPALAAARVPPAQALRPGGAEASARARVGWFAAGAAGLAVSAWVLARLPEPGRIPVLGFASALAAVLAAAGLAPVLLWAVLPRLRRALLARGRLAAGLAAGGLAGALRRSSILTAALAIAIGVMLGVAIMVGSFRETVSIWIGQQLQADVFVRPADWSRSRPVPLAPPVVAAIAATPGVAAIAASHTQAWTFRGQHIYVNTHWTLRGASLPGASLRGASRAEGAAGPQYRFLSGGPGAVIVSEPFARRFHLWSGDDFRLATPGGELPLRISGVFYDYASDRGQIVLAPALYTSAFGPPAPTELGLVAAPGVGAAELRRRVLLQPAPAGGGHAPLGLAGLTINDNRSLRAEAMRVFDQTFRITYALEGITLLVAILGVANTLLAVVLERGRELALLRFLGATRGQIRRLLVAEAALVASAALVLGWAAGVALSLILVRVINVQSFGWTIRFYPPYAFLLSASAAVWVATLLAGWLPARSADRVATPAALGAE